MIEHFAVVTAKRALQEGDCLMGAAACSPSLGSEPP